MIKPVRWLAALALALLLLTGAGTGPEEVAAHLARDFTVAYNGEVRILTDSAGERIYPIFYNGATYLPLRAVGDMLGVSVDWDGETRTVLLSDPAGGRTPAVPDGGGADDSGSEEIRAYLAPDLTVRYNGEAQVLRDAAGNEVCPLSWDGVTYLPVRAVGNMLGLSVDWDGETQTVLLNDPAVSEGARILGREHIGCGWAEIDWSTAGDGYARVTINRLPDGPSAYGVCRARWDDNGKWRYGDSYSLTEGEWDIPLYGGSGGYSLSVSLSFKACEHYRTEEEKLAEEEWTSLLSVRFDAEIADPDGVWLLSPPDIDFGHAPETRAKALELTQDCGTDAEKITAVFYWVAQTIQYDHEMAEKLMAEEEQNRASASCQSDEVNGRHWLPPDGDEFGYIDQSSLSLDTILTRESGVCAHYAAIMAGMLRSVGIPCKVVTGGARMPDGYLGHAWVAVHPETGSLDMDALGAGQDLNDSRSGGPSGPSGWIRLDPTNGLRRPEYTSDDENYLVYEHH